MSTSESGWHLRQAYLGLLMWLKWGPFHVSACQKGHFGLSQGLWLLRSLQAAPCQTQDFWRTARPTGRSWEAPGLPLNCVLEHVGVLLYPRQWGFSMYRNCGVNPHYQNAPQNFWMLWCGLPTQRCARRSPGRGTFALASQRQGKVRGGTELPWSQHWGRHWIKYFRTNELCNKGESLTFNLLWLVLAHSAR